MLVVIIISSSSGNSYNLSECNNIARAPVVGTVHGGLGHRINFIVNEPAEPRVST